MGLIALHMLQAQLDHAHGLGQVEIMQLGPCCTQNQRYYNDRLLRKHGHSNCAPRWVPALGTDWRKVICNKSLHLSSLHILIFSDSM
jgi:hypothetical protein